MNRTGVTAKLLGGRDLKTRSVLMAVRDDRLYGLKAFLLAHVHPPAHDGTEGVGLSDVLSARALRRLPPRGRIFPGLIVISVIPDLGQGGGDI